MTLGLTERSYPNFPVLTKGQVRILAFGNKENNDNSNKIERANLGDVFVVIDPFRKRIGVERSHLSVSFRRHVVVSLATRKLVVEFLRYICTECSCRLRSCRGERGRGWGFCYYF